MYGLETIKAMNEERARASKGQQPYVIKSTGEIAGMPPFPFPNFGDYRPKGWKLVETYFVDSSGMGSSDEPALTVEQFKKKLKVGFGYAIVEAGQFQVYVSEFKRVK